MARRHAHRSGENAQTCPSPASVRQLEAYEALPACQSPQPLAAVHQPGPLHPSSSRDCRVLMRSLDEVFGGQGVVFQGPSRA